jgi:hypothetical protein
MTKITEVHKKKFFGNPIIALLPIAACAKNEKSNNKIYIKSLQVSQLLLLGFLLVQKNNNDKSI